MTRSGPFLCDLFAGEAPPSRETSEVGFFGRGEIPPQPSGERTRTRHIEDAFAALAMSGALSRHRIRISP